MVFIMNREGTIVETVTSPVHQGSNANEILLLAPFAPTNTVTVGFKLPNGILIQPRLSESGTGETMKALEVNNLFLKIGADEESMSAWYIKINRDLTRYSGELGIQFFIYDGAGDILASSYATVTVQKGVAILDGTTFDTGTATQLQAELNKVYAALTAVKTDVSTLQTDMSVAKDDIADLKSSKLDKTGGTISGNLEVTGNLNVLGKTIESVLEKLNVKDAVIVTNADGSTLTVLSGFATRTGSDTTYGIMYDPASDSVKLGIVTADENGAYRFADGDGSPVATRADSADMADGKVVTWNAAKKRIETTTIPAVVDDTPTEGSSNLVTSGAVWKSEEDVISLVFNVGNGWGIQYEKDNDVLVLRNSFTSSESTVVLGIKDIEDRVDFLSTLLFNTIITNTTVEDTYTTRVTAGGLPVVSNTPTTVHKIAGDTKASENIVDIYGLVGDGITKSGVTITQEQDGYLHFSGIPTGNYRQLFTISQDLFQDGETYTFAQSTYFGVPGTGHTLKNSLYWSVVRTNLDTGDTNYSYLSTPNDSKSMTFDKKHYSYLIYIVNGNYAYTSGDEIDISLRFWANNGTTALPYSDYYAGLKSASFKGVTSTGRNLLDYSLDGGELTKNGVTVKSNNNTYTISGTPTVNDVIFKSFKLPASWAGKTITLSQSKYFTDLYDQSYKIPGAVYFLLHSNKNGYTQHGATYYKPVTVTIQEGYTYYLRIQSGAYAGSAIEEETISFMINEGSTVLPYEDYIDDTSFQLSAARQLRKWDYIDIDNQRLVTGTAEVTQETAFTDEELATYPAGYILSADRKTIAYPLETPTTAALTVPQTYTAWRNGSETVDTGVTDALPPTITQTYYEEVTA